MLSQPYADFKVIIRRYSRGRHIRLVTSRAASELGRGVSVLTGRASEWGMACHATWHSAKSNTTACITPAFACLHFGSSIRSCAFHSIQAGMDTEAITVLIDELAAQRIQLYVEGGVLRHRAAQGALTPERRALLEAHHDKIREAVRVRSYAGARPPEVPEAQAVWVPTSVQLMVLQWSAPIVMHDIRPVPVLDLVAAQAALDEVIARHDALRTRYTKDEDGRYWAVTQQRVKVSIEHADVSGLGAEDRANRIREIVRTLHVTPFDVEAGPLLRMGLVKVGEREMLCLLATCHSIFDRLSTDLFYREFFVLYRGFRSGTAPVLQPAPRFRDYAQQLNERLNSERGFEDFIYFWNRTLGRALDFPRSALLKPSAANSTYKPVPGAQRATSLMRFRKLDVRQFASLRNLARRERLTPFACALAAVGIALRSCARSKDAFVFLVQSARLTPQTAGLIGCCAIHSYFPMRFTNGQTLREVLHTVWKTYLEDMKHLLPAQNLIPIRNRLFDSGVFLATEFNYLRSESPAPAMDTSGANGRPGTLTVPVEEDGSVFRIRVCFYESDSELVWSVLHKSAAVEDETAERLSMLIQEVLVEMTRDVNAGLNATALEMNRGGTLHA
jgi:hypothetical protein